MAAVSATGAVLTQRSLHNGLGIWEESNCYLDVIIELLQEFGHEPEAALAVTLSADWEGDQWTFCKFNDEDLRVLYGLDIQELNPWENLHDHVRCQVRRGNPVLIEVDAWHLPDTRGSSYHRSHVKTTIAVMEIDPTRNRMRYLHGTGSHTLQDEDYRGLWCLDVPGSNLPPYVERVKIGDRPERDVQVRAALESLAREMTRIPARNPVTAFTDTLRHTSIALQSNGLEYFHRFAFATFRQIGAGAELLSRHLGWLNKQAGVETAAAAEAFLELSKTARTEQLKCARSVSRGRPAEIAATMASCWQAGVDALPRDF